MKRIILLIGACVCTYGASAQEELMRINPDAQSLGMGGLTMTSISGSDAIFNNPAAPVFSMKKMQVSGSYLSFDDVNYFSVSGFYNFDGRNVLEAGWRRHSFKPGTNHMSFEAGYAHRFGEKWSIGAVLRYYRYFYYWRSNSKNALAADLSAIYSQPLNFGEYSTLRVGGKIGNLGGYIGRYSRDDLEFSGTLGVALDTFITDAHEITVGADVNSLFSKGNQMECRFSLGAEYNLMQLLQLRAGYHYAPWDYDYYGNYFSVGVGVRFLHMRFDFAYLFAQKYAPMYNAINISFGFDF